MAKNTTTDTPTDAPAEDTPTRVAKVADMLVVTVDPASNNGHDTAPALVTSVDDDGLVHVLVFRETAAPPQLYGGLAVFPDRAAVDNLTPATKPGKDGKPVPSGLDENRPAFACYYA